MQKMETEEADTMQTASSDVLTSRLTATRSQGQPQTFYRALKQTLEDCVGFQFLTIFVVDGGETRRVFSTEPNMYPIGERKPMAATEWGEQVLRQHRSFLARNFHEVKNAFFDHEKIFSLGCGSAISVPVVYNGRCLGVVNLNHREHTYNSAHLRTVEALAPTLIPTFINAISG